MSSFLYLESIEMGKIGLNVNVRLLAENLRRHLTTWILIRNGSKGNGLDSPFIQCSFIHNKFGERWWNYEASFTYPPQLRGYTHLSFLGWKKKKEFVFFLENDFCCWSVWRDSRSRSMAYQVVLVIFDLYPLSGRRHSKNVHLVRRTSGEWVARSSSSSSSSSAGTIRLFQWAMKTEREREREEWRPPVLVENEDTKRGRRRSRRRRSRLYFFFFFFFFFVIPAGSSRTMSPFK